MKRITFYLFTLLILTGCASALFNTGASVSVDLKNLNNHVDYLVGDSVKINVIAFDRERIKSLKIDLRFQNEEYKRENNSRNRNWDVTWSFKINDNALVGNTSIKITLEDLKGDLFILPVKINIKDH